MPELAVSGPVTQVKTGVGVMELITKVLKSICKSNVVLVSGSVAAEISRHVDRRKRDGELSDETVLSAKRGAQCRVNRVHVKDVVCCRRICLTDDPHRIAGGIYDDAVRKFITCSAQISSL